MISESWAYLVPSCVKNKMDIFQLLHIDTTKQNRVLMRWWMMTVCTLLLTVASTVNWWLRVLILKRRRENKDGRATGVKEFLSFLGMKRDNITRAWGQGIFTCSFPGGVTLLLIESYDSYLTSAERTQLGLHALVYNITCFPEFLLGQVGADASEILQT